jgi:hypothetical protein
LLATAYRNTMYIVGSENERIFSQVLRFSKDSSSHFDKLEKAMTGLNSYYVIVFVEKSELLQ